MPKKREIIKLDNTIKGRLLTRAIEGKGKARRVVYRVGEGHTPEFYRQHRRGTIWTSSKFSKNRRSSLIQATKRLKVINNTRTFLSGHLKLSPLSKTELRATRSRKKNLISQKKRSHVIEIETTRRPNKPAQVGGEFTFTVVGISKGKKRTRQLSAFGFSPKSKIPANKWSSRFLRQQINKAELSAKGGIAVSTGLTYSSITIVDEPEPLIYKYYTPI